MKNTIITKASVINERLDKIAEDVKEIGHERKRTIESLIHEIDVSIEKIRINIKRLSLED